MCVLKKEPGAKARRDGEAVHRDLVDGSAQMRGLSPSTGGSLSSFSSAGPVLSLRNLIQPKLTIGQPNDMYEQEADRVADQVMSMPEPKGSVAQRKTGCPECSEEEMESIQTKPLSEQITPLVQRQVEEEEEEEPIQTKPLSGKQSQVTVGLQNQIQLLRGGGQPLAQSTRAFFEPRFGHDFSHVRVHTDGKASEAAKSINAKAFTTGKDVLFGAGQYSPGTHRGKFLLAHELAHVLQQNGSNGILHLQRDSNDPNASTQTQAPPDPLRLVFYQQGSSASAGFNGYAETLAKNLNALRLPYKGCKTSTKKIGSIPCDRSENALKRAADYASCLNQKIEQLHVVGHIPSSGAACLSGVLDSDSAKWYLPNAKVVVHGCRGVTRFRRGTESIIKQLPDAAVYVHKESAEAGGPLDFYKITVDPGSADSKTIKSKVTNVTNEGIGFTPESIKKWAESHLKNVKRAAKYNDKGTLRNILNWLIQPNFASNEVAVFADIILADTSKKIPQNILKAAEEFKKNWQASQQSTSP